MRRPWTPADERRLSELRDAGLTHAQIAKRMRRSKSAVSSKLNVLQLVDEELSRARSSAEEMTTKQHTVFCEFLRKHIRTWPESVLARSWSDWAGRNDHPTVTAKRVAYWVRKLGIGLSEEEKKANPNYQNVRKPRAHLDKLFETVDLRAEEKRKEFRVLFDEMLAETPNTPQRICLECQELWPCCPPFYAISESESFHHTCVLCETQYRRALQRAEGAGTDTSLIRGSRKRKLRERLDTISEAQRRDARAECEEIFSENPQAARRTCVDCEEVWALRRQFFYPAKKSGSFKRTCRFCDNEHRRGLRRAAADNESTQVLKESREDVRRQMTDQKHRDARDAMLRDSDQYRSHKREYSWRDCPQCGAPLPLVEKFWCFRKSLKSKRKKGGITALDKPQCVCCLRENRVAAKRARDDSG